jgi:hypothetical protein
VNVTDVDPTTNPVPVTVNPEPPPIGPEFPLGPVTVGVVGDARKT